MRRDVRPDRARTDRRHGGGRGAIAGTPLLLRHALLRSGPELERTSNTSVAIREGRIAAIGPSAALPGARVVDLDGALVLPGFVDTHAHLGWASEGMWRVDWSPVSDRAAALDRLRIVVGRIDPGFWIVGGSWDRGTLPDTELPSLAELDAATGDAPLFLVSEDRSLALANTRALSLFRVDAPDGRLRDRLARARATAQAVPPADRHRRRAELSAALRELASRGVTEVHDIATYPDPGPTPIIFRERGFTDATLFEELEDRGELTARVSVRPSLDRWDVAAERARSPRERIRGGGVKMIIDEGRYSTGSPGGYEYRYPGFDRALEWMREADRAGLDVTLHGLGDLGVSEALDLFDAIATSEPARPRRPRLAHGRRIEPDDIARLARLGVTLEAQPWDLIEQLPILSRRFDADFLATAYPYGDVLRAGGRIVFGSDWRITPQRPDLRDMQPLAAMHVSVFRAPPEDGAPWQAAQRIGVAQAIRAYTEDAAWVGRAEHRRGTIREGADADLVVLSDDVIADPTALARASVRMTIVAGEVVFEADSAGLR